MTKSTKSLPSSASGDPTPPPPWSESSNRKSIVETRRSRSRVQPLRKPKSRQKKKSGRVDTKMPKKPPTAFFYFLEDFRKEYQEQNPDVKSMREIGKACGEKWKVMTYEEKVKYYDIATEKRAEFDQAMAEYTKRKELSKESETDSEFSE